MEQWKDVIGFEDSYQISNYGRVRSKDRFIKVCGNGERLIKGQIIKPSVCKNGYYEVMLSRNKKRKVYLLHRLVAIHFIENPNNLPQINHKDEDITNNRVDNLEWCTSKYNANYGTRNARCNEKVIRKPVKQLTLEGKLIKEFPAVKEAMRQTGIDDSQIIRVCMGKNKTAGGYKWEYA